MKIVKEVGEQPIPRLHRRIAAELRPILAIRGAGASLYTGSRILIHRGWTLLGERLDGWERYGALAFGGYVAVYACGHAPHLARFAVPGTVVAWCAAAWCMAPASTDEPRNEPTEEQPAEPDPQDVEDLVRDLIGDDRGVLLTTLRQPLHAPNTRAVRELLDAAGIRVRPGVRTAGGNGPGVHRDDLTAPSPAPADPPVDVVAAGEDANTNTNNTLRVESREGMTIINDPADRHRAHSLKKGP
ncbi:hypothetical protein ACFC01_18040 [Streptomyces mirabilis]|uniref:hypothetical protein n=1 Tax=Streptomyces mirabilis TaxID=68239 RepID=UPI0035DA8978